MKQEENKEIKIYQTKDGEIKLDVHFDQEPLALYSGAGNAHLVGKVVAK